MTGDLALQLLAICREIRPEVDRYLLSDRDWDRVAGSQEASDIRRIFFGVEEVKEVHLSVLDGVRERYQTPFFDNLKAYARRPMGTYHALPIARGKSIFKSNWIRDMGEFYGANLFMAESSATTGGLDSLLEPTGNIKKAQQLAAKAFGADHAYFVTNGTSTANKIVGQAVCKSRATSCSSTGTAQSPITTPACCPAPSPTTSTPSPCRSTRCTAACRSPT